MNFYKKLIIVCSLSFVFILIGFLVFSSRALATGTYPATGLLVSTNILAGQTPSVIDSFTYNASSIPAGTGLAVQFSKDNANWWSSAGVFGNWDTLSSGSHTIDLSARGWGGSYFYYKIQFTSDGTDTPVLDSVSSVFYAKEYNSYSASGTLTSSNLFSASSTVTDIVSSFDYNISSLPANTGITIQFSPNNTQWYNSAGVLNSSSTLSVGTSTIDLSGMVWTGPYFYYKAVFTSDGTDTSVLDSVSLNFNSNNYYWVGTAGGSFNTASNWSGTSGGSGGAGVPGASDNAIFDSGGVNNASIDANVSVKGISITAGYTGTITQSSTYTVTLGASGYVQAGGTFTGGTGAITDSTDFTISGGAFTSTSGTLSVAGAFTHSAGTFAHNSGSVLLKNTSSKALTLSAATTFNHLYINDGLVGYWKFDEAAGTSAADSSGYGNTGTNNGATITSATDPVHFTDAKLLSFDGTDDYINMGNILPMGLNSLTVNGWFKTTSNPATVGLFGKTSTRGYLGRYGVLFYGGNISVVYDFDGGGAIFGTSQTSYIDGTWHMVTAVYNRAGSATLYVDGVNKASSDISAYSAVDMQGTDRFIVGGYGDGPGTGVLAGSYFDGLMDDVRIYNRALSAQEVQALAAGNQPATSIATTTVTGGDLDVNGNLVINAGTLDTGTRDITVGGSWENNGGKFTPGSKTVTLDGTATTNIILSGGQKFNNLTINDTAGTGTWTLADRLNVNSNPSTTPSTLTITNGILDVRGSLGDSSVDYTLHASKWTQTGGTFTCRSGTVVLDSIVDATFTPSSSFNILRIEDPSESGLVGYWKFDEENGTIAFDSSGNSNTGTLTNTPSRSYTVNGTIVFDNPESMSFDGVDDYVSVGDADVFDFSGAFSLEAWVYAESTDPGYIKGIVAKETGDSGDGFSIGQYGGQWAWWVSGSYIVTSTNFSLNNWHHIVGVYSGAGSNLHLYADGQEVGTPTAATLINNNDELTIGRWIRDGAAQRYWDGSIDDVRIYDRALSETEVANLYAGRYASGATGTATHTLSANLATGNMAIDSGILDASTAGCNSTSCSITASGNWSNFGSFVARLGTVILDGANQILTSSATTTFNALTKDATSSAQTLTFGTTGNFVITATTTLQGTSIYPLSLRSSSENTEWHFQPDGTRAISYLDVQDSHNTSTEINTTDYSGIIDSGNNTGWAFVQPYVTVSKSGAQIATTTTPVTGLNLGGAISLEATYGNITVDSIKFKQVGSLATSSIDNIRLYYKVEGTCSAVKPADAELFGIAADFDVNKIATTTGNVVLTAGSTTCMYFTYDLVSEYSSALLGRSIDLEITSPVNDVLVTNGIVSTVSTVNIAGRTIIVSANSDVEPDPVLNNNIISLLSLKVSDSAKDPTLFYLQNSAVWKKEGSSDAIRLTSPNLRVHTLTFTDLTGANNAGTVKMTMTLSNVAADAADSFLNVIRTYTTTATVKAWGGN